MWSHGHSDGNLLDRRVLCTITANAWRPRKLHEAQADEQDERHERTSNEVPDASYTAVAPGSDKERSTTDDDFLENGLRKGQTWVWNEPLGLNELPHR